MPSGRVSTTPRAVQIQLKGPASFTPSNYNITGGILVTANGATITVGGSTKPSQYTLGGVGFVNSGNTVTVTSTASFWHETLGDHAGGG